MIKKIFLFACVAFLLSSCLDESTKSNADSVALSVAGASIDNGKQVSTRGSIVDGSIGVYRIASTNYQAQNNYEYVCTGGAWKEGNSSQKILVGNSVNLLAYSPYYSSINISAIPLTSSVDAIDLCYQYQPGVSSTSVESTGVTFALEHAYAKLTLHFSKNNDLQGTGDVKKITITGAVSSEILNLSTGTPLMTPPQHNPVTVSDGVATIFNIKTVPNNTFDVELLMAPGSFSSNLTFTLNVDGTDKTATLPAASLSGLSAGTHYTVPIEIGQKNILDLGTTANQYVTITDWTTTAAISNPLLDLPAQPESNCYIVSPGSTIYIPVSRASAGNSSFLPTDAFTAGLLWSDVNASHVTASAVGRYIKVTVPSGATEGNSVVYAKKGTDIVWSWHIWVTAYAPGLAANTGTNTTTYQSVNGLLWMDRNLGATAVAGTANFGDCGGLMYQWGRKDPFPGSDGVSLTAPKSISVVVTPNKGTKISSDNVYFYSLTTSDYSSALTYSIQSPLTFFGNWAGSTATAAADGTTAAGGIYSWNCSDKKETIYDPCPAGWRVPAWIGGTPASPWAVLPSSLSMTNKGTVTAYDNFQSYQLGTYPASGNRHYNFGALDTVGNNGYYWSGSVPGASAYALSFNSNGTVTPNGLSFRAAGFSVRCVKN